jgi:DNA-binding NtrC family response regulator
MTFRILHVEDDPLFSRALARYLRFQGHTIVSAVSVFEAKTLFSPNAFNIVLCDYRLPDGTGLDVYEHVHHVAPTQKFLMLSADPMEGLACPSIDKYTAANDLDSVLLAAMGPAR